MYIILWILGVVATYRLWEDTRWLSIITILLVLSYQAWPEEQQEHNTNGEYSNTTATRFAWTFVLVVGIFLYSLLK
jgi:hypothetical protein